MKNRVKILINLMVIMLIIVSGCNRVEVSRDEYEKLRGEIEVIDGITVLDIEDVISRFVYKIYSPASETDIIEGIQLLEDITTEDEYNELKTIVGEYNQGVKIDIENLTVKYSVGSNHTDNLSRAYTEFTINKGEYKQNIAIEFVFNGDGKIFKHYIWQGTIYK